MQALLIFPDGEVRIENVGDVYPDINRALGVQWIEGIYTYGPDLAFYLDEEGKYNGHERNPIAERLYREHGGELFDGDYLVGPVAIVSYDDETGEALDHLPDDLLEWANTMV